MKPPRCPECGYLFRRGASRVCSVCRHGKELAADRQAIRDPDERESNPEAYARFKAPNVARYAQRAERGEALFA